MTFGESELLIINIYAPDNYDENLYGGDSWGNTVCGWAIADNKDAERFYAPDYDGTTDGDSDGINVLIRRIDLPAWQEAASGLDCLLEISNILPEAGHYGDGGWEGVTLVQEKAGLRWIEGRVREESP